MRIQKLSGLPPQEIPVAGVMLSELLGNKVEVADLASHFTNAATLQSVSEVVLESDEIRHFRTPAWTWSNMCGREGFVVIRSGRAVFWLVTRMN
jgi:hypothetical protein